MFQNFKQLEKDLVDAFVEFRKIYIETAGLTAELTNQQIYDIVFNEYEEYSGKIQLIRLRVSEIMKKMKTEQDIEKYNELLNKLKIKSVKENDADNNKSDIATAKGNDTNLTRS